ncbi:MAG: Crp/Fnr family transcriptional regulator [Chloroflexi bacterium]|nr:Crp/Fnr family transcriptional regulator [Chloroflexota bacterium]
MLSDDKLAEARAALPVLRSAPAALLDEFRRIAFIARIPAGRNVFVEGDRVGAIPLLISGTVRVYQVGETGREVTLYRFRPGESCVLTANAILTGQGFPAIATVEDEAEAVMVPAETFSRWVGRDDLWRQFFVDLVAQRLASVMSVVDEVAFKRLDQRVAALLARRARDTPSVRITHQEIAAELGSAREAVSRVLEDLAAKGLVQPGRGTVVVPDVAALEAIARTVT